MAFVQQESGTWGSSCQVNQEHLMKGLLLSVCWAASGVRCKPKGLIKGFLWRSGKADSRGQNAGPQTGCDPHTCLVALYCNVSAHSGHAHTDTSLPSRCLPHTRRHTERGSEPKGQVDLWICDHPGTCRGKCRQGNLNSGAEQCNIVYL